MYAHGLRHSEESIQSEHVVDTIPYWDALAHTRLFSSSKIYSSFIITVWLRTLFSYFTFPFIILYSYKFTENMYILIIIYKISSGFSRGICQFHC